MKILYVTNSFPSRSETFIYSKVVGMAMKGHQVHVVCSRFNKSDFQDTAHELLLRHSLITIPRLILYALFHPYKAWLHILKKQTLSSSYIVHTATKFQPDITHFVFSGLGILYLNVVSKIPGRKVVSCRGSAEKLMPLLDSSRKDKLITLFSQVDAIHCVSENMRKTIYPYCTAPEKIFVQYTGINTSLFRPVDSKTAKATVFTLLSVGRLTLQKGYITGMHVMHKLKKSGYTFRWLIVGEGPQRAEVSYHAFFMNLAEEIVFAGGKTSAEIRDLYASVDMFFLPSIYEGISNAVLEAMCMKLPVVCTRSGGIEEVIQDGVNGFTADVGDVDEMYSRIAALINDIKLRETIGSCGHHSVFGQFTVENYVAGFEKNYQKLLG
jgi:glycosyltransferase involved in cell wall biosynthesis